MQVIDSGFLICNWELLPGHLFNGELGCGG